MLTTHLSSSQIWGMPIAIGVMSAVGLISALLGDGIWDTVSWIALAIPVAVILWYGLRPHRQGQSPRAFHR